MPFSFRTMKDETRDILSLFVLCLLCYYDKILLGPYAVIDFYDTLEVHFSHFKAMADLWASYGPFSWYPYHAGGVPSFVGQHPPYHPAVFLTGVLPIWLVALLWNISQMFLAGYGMYRFLPLLLRVSRRTALVCASLSSLLWISGNVHMVMPSAFPALFAWTYDLHRSDSGRLTRVRSAFYILLVSLFSFPVLTLPHFPTLHLVLVLFLGRHLQDFRRQVAGVFLVWTAYVLIFTPSIVSLFQYIPYAQRDWDFVFPGWGAAMQDFGHWVKGRLGDQPMLGLLFLAIPLHRQRQLRICLLIFVSMLLVSGVFNSELKALFEGTFLLKMDLFMFATTTGILAVMITALAIEVYTKRPEGLRLWPVLAAAAPLPLFGSAHKMLTYLFLLGAGVAAILILRRDWNFRPAGRLVQPGRLNWVVAAFVVCLCGTGLMVRQQMMTAGLYVPYAKGYQGHPALDRLSAQARQTPLRVACLDVHPAVIQARGLDTVGGKSPLFNKYYKEYVREAIRPQLESDLRVRQFDNLWRQLYLTRNQIDHDERPLALKAVRPRTAADFNWPLLLGMNVTHVVSAAPVQGLDGLSSQVEYSPGLVLQEPWQRFVGLDTLHAMPLWIYTLKNPQGLARLAAPVLLASEEQVLTALGRVDVPDLRRTAYLVADSSPGALAGISQPDATRATSGSVHVVQWEPDRLVLHGQAEAPCVLAVSNNYDPRWRATVNGQERGPVFRVNHAFQGVLIEAAGPFTVELRYSAPLIWWCHAASAVGVLLLCVGLFLPRAPAQLARSQAQEPPGVQAQTPLCLLSGVAMAAVWAVTFAFFVMRRHRGPQAETFLYALATLPVLALLLSGWVRQLLRRL